MQSLEIEIGVASVKIVFVKIVFRVKTLKIKE